MSMEAQFYEARRRQSSIERRHSLRSEKEIDKQPRRSEYQSLYIPIRPFRQDEKIGRCTCIPMRRASLVYRDQLLYQRDRDIYPRPPPIPTNIRRYIQRPTLRNRFSSTDYLQQW